MATKRIISILLLVLIVLSQIPMETYASKDDRTEYIYSDNGLVDENENLLSGGIRTGKTVAETGIVNEYQVTMEVESKEKTLALDTSVVFLVDISSDSILEDNISFLKDIIPEIYNKNPDNRISVIALSENIDIISGFKDASDTASLLSDVGSISSKAGNFLEEGIRTATQLLNLEANENKLIITLSKGLASYSYKVGSIVSAEVYCDTHGVTDPVWSIVSQPDDIKEKLGRGDNMASGILSAYKLTVPRTTCNEGYYHTRSNKYPHHHGELAISESKIGINSGVDIISVMLSSPESLSLDVMEGIQNKGFFANTADGKEGVLSYFKEEIKKAYSSAVITENISKGIILDKESIVISSGELSVDENEIVWDISEDFATIKYVVTVDVKSASFNEDGIILSENAVFSYGENQFSINQPVIVGYYSEVFLQGILVDYSGNYIDEDGNTVELAQDAKKLTDKTEYSNENAINRWVPGSSIEVNAKVLGSLEGYILHPDTKEKFQFALKEEPASAVVYFPYITEEVTYKVEHYLEGNQTPFDTQNIYGKVNDIVIEVSSSLLLPKGYKRISTDGLPLKLTNNGAIVKVFYAIDSEQTVEYIIKYYKDGEFTEEKKGETTRASSKVTIMPDKEKYSGYLFSKIVFYDITKTESFTTDISSEKNMFHVYYTKEKMLPYAIDYYKGHQLIETEDKEVAWAERNINITPDADKYLGYKLDSIVFGHTSGENELNVTISETENLVKVNYIIDEDKTLPYSIEYYRDGVFTEKDDKKVYTANPTIKIQVDENKYEGYSFENIKFYDKESQNSELTVEITPERSVVTINYTKNDEGATNIPYKINYYRNGELKNTKDKSVDINTPSIDFAVDKAFFEGAKYIKLLFGEKEYTDDTATLVITNTENEINIYYEDIKQVLVVEEIYYDGVLQDRLDTYVEPENVSKTFSPAIKREESNLSWVSFGGEGEHKDENKAKTSITRSVTDTQYVFRAYYVKSDITFTFRYYYDNEEYRAKSTQSVIAYGSIVDENYISDESFGYSRATKFTKPALPFTADSGLEVNVYYKSDNSTELPYYIEYYKDDNLAFRDEKKAYASDSVVTLDIEQLKSIYLHDGYTFSSVYFMTQQGGTGDIKIWRNTFKVYYTRSEEPEYLRYSVEHYYDNILGETRNYKALKDTPYVENKDIEYSLLQGYALSKIEPPLPYFLQKDNDIIKVYYVSDGGEKPSGKMDIYLVIKNLEAETEIPFSVSKDISVIPYQLFDAYIFESDTRKLDYLEIEYTPLASGRAVLGYSDNTSLGYSGNLPLGYSGEELDGVRYKEPASSILYTAKDIVRKNDTYAFTDTNRYRVKFIYKTVEPEDPNDPDDGNNAGSDEGGNQVIKDTSSYRSSSRKTHTSEKVDKDTNLTLLVDTAPPVVKATLSDEGNNLEGEDKRKGLTLPKTGGGKITSIKAPVTVLIVMLILASFRAFRKLFRTKEN